MVFLMVLVILLGSASTPAPRVLGAGDVFLGQARARRSGRVRQAARGGLVVVERKVVGWLGVWECERLWAGR